MIKTTLSQQENRRSQESRLLESSASDFEAIFLKQMLTSMRRTVPKSREGEQALFKESEGEKIFLDLLDGEYAKVMSRTGRGLGLKEFILKNSPGASAARSEPRNVVTTSQAELLRLQAQSNSLNALSQMPIRKMVGGN